MDNKQKGTNDKSIPCPECEALITTSGNLTLGQIIECPACGVECECIKLNPLILAPLEEEK